MFLTEALLLCYAQSLPSFGPYLVEKKEIIASYKKKSRDAGATTAMEGNAPRVSTPTKPVPAVKVSCIQTRQRRPAVSAAALLLSCSATQDRTHQITGVFCVCCLPLSCVGRHSESAALHRSVPGAEQHGAGAVARINRCQAQTSSMYSWPAGV